MAFHSYKQYLQSDHWKALRAKKLELAGRKCNRCGRTDHLEVHHLRYRRHWLDCDVNDLEVLCGNCHSNHHEQEKIDAPFEAQAEAHFRRRIPPENLKWLRRTSYGSVCARY